MYTLKKVTHNILVYRQIQIIYAVTCVLYKSYVIEYKEYNFEDFGRFHAFEERKKCKIHKFENWENFYFLYIFHKCLVDVRQSWSLSIEFWGFHFSSPSGFNAIHAFNMRFHVSQKRIAIILLPICDKLQYVVSICQNLHRVRYLAFGTNFFPKFTTAKTPTIWQIVNYVIRIRRIHKLQYHRRFLILFSMVYPLFNKIQRNFHETVC